VSKTPEAKVKKQCTEMLKFLECYYFYPVTGGYGKSGVPDIVGVYQGRFFGIECKAGDNKPTALQKKNLIEIERAGGLSLLINETNVKHLESYLKEEMQCGLHLT